MIWNETFNRNTVSYFSHGDYPLAIRRTLDAAFDTDDRTLIRGAIAWGNRGQAALDAAKRPTSFSCAKAKNCLPGRKKLPAPPSTELNKDFYRPWVCRKFIRRATFR